MDNRSMELRISLNDATHGNDLRALAKASASKPTPLATMLLEEKIAEKKGKPATRTKKGRVG